MLTKEEIMQLEGLELDMLVGQFVIKFEDYLKEFGRRPVVRDGRYGKNYFDLPTYSTDISAAWEVVEELCGKYSLVLQREGDYLNDDDVYECRIGGLSELVVAKTAPLAICRAALLAVMEDTNDKSL